MSATPYYSLRLARVQDLDSSSFDQTRLGWFREIRISEQFSLEALSSIILEILGWEADRLYEFRCRDRLYMGGDDEFYEDTGNQCLSCAVRLQDLKLNVGDKLQYVFDFARYYAFCLTVTDKAVTDGVLPAIVAHHGGSLQRVHGEIVETNANDGPPVLVAKKRHGLSNRLQVRFVGSDDRKSLEKWRTSNNRRLWGKAVTILENRNLSVEEIASKLELPKSRVQGWIVKFNRHGLAGISGVRESRKPRKRGERVERCRKQLLDILHDRPKSFGINRASWSLPSLSLAYEKRYGERISESTVSRLVKQSGFSFKKARRVLTSPDPDYREKVELLLRTLHGLGGHDFLFFIDEMGPLRIKKYGGKSLVAKGTFSVVPQVQADRGSITMSASLSATKNQVTWLYSAAKDSRAMIDLIEVLFNQHHSANKLFLTWDAASWHRSTELLQWLDAFNVGTNKAGYGPRIELVPLPRSAQFLDVLEAVFSGMKRAVIHHSDYKDKVEMKSAISEHFFDRNEHFRKNPRRAGKKIWDIDFFHDVENIKSGNYREW